MLNSETNALLQSILNSDFFDFATNEIININDEMQAEEKGLLHLLNSFVFMQKANYSESLKAVDSAFQYLGNYLLFNLLRGYLHYKLKNYNEAIAHFQICIDNHYKLEISLFYKGNSYLIQEEYEEAILCFTQVLEISRNAVAYNNLAVAKAESGKYIEALKYLENSIETNKNLTIAYYNIGLIKFIQGERNESLEFYNKAIEINNTIPELFFQRARNKIGLELFEDAIQDYNFGLKLKPHAHNALFYRGFTQIAIGNFKEAVSDFEQSILFASKNKSGKLNPNISRANFYKALASFNENKDKFGLAANDLQYDWIDFYGLCSPAYKIGGDYFYLFTNLENEISLIIGDVSGKGTSGALLMSSVMGLVDTARKYYSLPNELLYIINEFMVAHIGITRKSKLKKFVTTIYGTIQKTQNEILFNFSNAGHLKPIFFRDGKNIEFTSHASMALGIARDVNYNLESIPLLANDFLLFYTDGAIEQTNPEGKAFDYSRLIDFTKRNIELSSKDFCHALLDEIIKFSSGNGQHDDISLIAIKIK